MTDSDTITATATPVADAPAQATPTLGEAIRKKLEDAPAPLKFGDLKKNLPKAKKQSKDDFENEIRRIVNEEVAVGRAFVAKSGKAGEERFWSKDEAKEIQDSIIALAAIPTPLKDLLKNSVVVMNKSDAAYVESLFQQLIVEQKLFEHPPAKPGKPALFGTTEYRSPNDKEKVTEALLAAAATPQLADKLDKDAVAKTGAEKAFVSSTREQLVGESKLFEYPPAKAGKPALFGATVYRNPNDKQTVTEALLAAAATPQTKKDLVEIVVEKTKADKAFVSALAQELIDSEKLHKDTVSKNKYTNTKPKPPHALDIAPGKKAFDGFVTSAKKLINAVPGLDLEEVFHRLREALEHQPTHETSAKPKPVEKTEHKAKDEPKPAEAHGHTAPPTIHKPTDLTPEAIRKGLKEAYDELCLDVEFQDKLVEIPRLYHETKKLLPNLTVQKFHHELEHLAKERKLELQSINEVARAKEPELAIRHEDHLIYFVIWN